MKLMEVKAMQTSHRHQKKKTKTIVGYYEATAGACAWWLIPIIF